MTVRIGINGFGRIGRVILRSLLEGYGSDIEVVHINSRGDSVTAAHLFKYDSNYGTFAGEVSSTESSLIIDGREFSYSRHAAAESCHWDGVDIVMECTGKMKDRASNEIFLKNGASYVLVAYPCADADTTIVYGVNHASINKKTRIISNGSCTTNCLAPPLSVLHDSLGIVNGAMTTIHSYTSDQNLLDGSHKDLRRARSAATSIVPTSTGAARNIGLVIPALQGKLNGYAIRVPTAVVSCIDVTLNLGESTSIEAVNKLMLENSLSKLAGVMRYSDVPLVSVDFIGESSSCVFDSGMTQMVGDKTLRILGWYDNEWGFSCRMLDVASYIKTTL